MSKGKGMSMTDFDRDQLDSAYHKRFKTFPPIIYWHGTYEGLQELMLQAMKRGRALTAKDLAEAQGHELPPPDAKS